MKSCQIASKSVKLHNNESAFNLWSNSKKFWKLWKDLKRNFSQLLSQSTISLTSHRVKVHSFSYLKTFNCLVQRSFFNNFPFNLVQIKLIAQKLKKFNQFNHFPLTSLLVSQAQHPRTRLLPFVRLETHTR